MGRGRAKAKQTKVARDLKYRTHQTDFSALAQELHSGADRPPASSDDNLDATDDEYDEWADYGDPADPADSSDRN